MDADVDKFLVYPGMIFYRLPEGEIIFEVVLKYVNV